MERTVQKWDDMPFEDVSYEIDCYDLDKDNIKEIVFSSSNSKWVKTYIYTVTQYNEKIIINQVKEIKADGNHITLKKVI